MLPNEKLEDYILKGIIQIACLPSCEDELSITLCNFRRGKNNTFSNENVPTRMGKSAKFMVTGDPGQVDLPRRTISGLKRRC
jgi:phosphate starvation-inducible PhoH-like protein